MARNGDSYYQKKRQWFSQMMKMIARNVKILTQMMRMIVRNGKMIVTNNKNDCH